MSAADSEVNLNPIDRPLSKGHVSEDRARELVNSSPSLTPIRSGLVAEPMIQLSEEGTIQFSNLEHESVHKVALQHGFKHKGYSSGSNMHVYHNKEGHTILNNPKKNEWHFLHGNTPHGPGDSSGHGNQSLHEHLGDFA